MPARRQKVVGVLIFGGCLRLTGFAAMVLQTDERVLF